MSAWMWFGLGKYTRMFLSKHSLNTAIQVLSPLWHFKQRQANTNRDVVHEKSSSLCRPHACWIKTPKMVGTQVHCLCGRY